MQIIVSLHEAGLIQDGRKIGSPRPNAGEGLGVRGIKIYRVFEIEFVTFVTIFCNSHLGFPMNIHGERAFILGSPPPP